MHEIEAMYGLDRPIRSFAVANEFVERMNKGCYSLGKNLQPFCFYATDLQKEWGVLDIASFSGFVNSENTLISEIVDYRREQYCNGNFGILPKNDMMSKVLFYDYLLSISICYVEIPKWSTKNGVRQKTYEKFLATRNPNIMASWMGYTASEMQAKYSTKIRQSNVDFIASELRAVKLVSTTKGNSITCPRNSMPVLEMTCIPLFMLYAMTAGFYSVLENSIIKFTYMKDNGTLRELASTVSPEIMLDYYSDNNFVAGMLRGIDVFSEEQGGMKLSTKQSRGYIKLPELGCSKYDATGVRSLNLVRILRMEEVQEVDRTFIDVDLNSIISHFNNHLDNLLEKRPAVLYPMYIALGCEVEGVSQESSALSISNKIREYIGMCDMLLSTSFRRSLHLFMIQHTDWFSNYTGLPLSEVSTEGVVNSANFGLETMDF